MAYLFPAFFVEFFTHLQEHNEVGILTARSEEQKEEVLKQLESVGIKPDFYIGKPEQLKGVPNGVYKGLVCKEADIDILFDDFDYSDEKMVADFFSVNSKTVPFTSWGYRP